MPGQPPPVWTATHDPADADRYRAAGWWTDRSHLDDFLVAVDRHPGKTAVVAVATGTDQIDRLTYRELADRIDRLALTYRELGVEAGDVVSIQLCNGWQFPVAMLAAQRIGAIPNPIPPIYREREVEFMLRHARSRVFVTHDSFKGFDHAGLAIGLQAAIPTLAHCIIVGDARAGTIAFDAALAPARQPGPATLDPLRPGADDVAVILFTSGTTGTPKAALHTHNTIRSAGAPIPEALSLGGDDVAFMASTVGHLTGFYWGTLLPLAMGQTVVYQDNWDPAGFVELVEREGVTWTLSATPFALDMVAANRVKRRSLASLRAFVCGGAPIPPHVPGLVADAAGTDLISLWGCTEVGICTIHTLGADAATLAASDGMPVARMTLRVVDEDLAPVADGEEGRLQVRGPGIFAGYLRQPELTEELRTPDGWFDTGDRGRRTSDGGIRISGRSKDIIIRGGQNVPVVEIENELLTLAGVAEVAVVGVPDERLGERGCAVIVADGTPPSLAEVQAFLATRGVAKQFWPEHLHVQDALPRTPSGKVQKYVLRAERAAALQTA